MRPDSKKRIDTQAARQPFTGIGSAFSGIDISGLPSGPEAAPRHDCVEPTWKMGRVVLQRETAHRGGKTVIVIHDFATHLPQTVIDKTASKLRSACGCGGTVKGRTIEIQGDQPAKIRTLLESEGFQVAGVK